METATTPPLEPSYVEPSPMTHPPAHRLAALERLVRAIEDELADDELDAETKLQNIAERVASATDGR